MALKVLPELLVSDPDRVRRFEREAQSLAALNHPNIAQVFGVIDVPGAEGGEGTAARAALVMEFVDGEDLAQRLERGPAPLDEGLAIARQIAEALCRGADPGGRVGTRGPFEPVKRTESTLKSQTPNHHCGRLRYERAPNALDQSACDLGSQ